MTDDNWLDAKNIDNIVTKIAEVCYKQPSREVICALAIVICDVADIVICDVADYDIKDYVEDFKNFLLSVHTQQKRDYHKH